VTASALNVREEPSTEAGVVLQLKKNAPLTVLGSDESWLKVRLEDGRTGWVAERFVSEERAQGRQQLGKKRSGCESDYAFIQTPALSFSQEDAHGLVVVEANVNAKGVVTATKVVTNNTGDPGAGAVAEREIRSAKFAPPMRNCVPRAFVFTYRRTF
jgi:TonB family protein